MKITLPIQIKRGTKAQILAVTTGLDGEPYYSTDTEEFFIADDTGVPQALTPPASVGIRSTETYTTASLAIGSSDGSGTIALPKSASILSISTDFPAWVRLYLSSAYRTADDYRSSGVDPSGDHGQVLEVITTSAMLSLKLSPVAVWGGIDSGTIGYLSIKNLDNTARAVTVTLGLLSMEA